MGTVPHAVILPDRTRARIAALAEELEFALLQYGRSPTRQCLDEIELLETEAGMLADEVSMYFGVPKADIMRKIGFPVEGL